MFKKGMHGSTLCSGEDLTFAFIVCGVHIYNQGSQLSDEIKQWDVKLLMVRYKLPLTKLVRLTNSSMLCRFTQINATWTRWLPRSSGATCSRSSSSSFSNQSAAAHRLRAR